VKVLRRELFDPTSPAPPAACWTPASPPPIARRHRRRQPPRPRQLPGGTHWRRHVRARAVPAPAEALIEVLDAMPGAVAGCHGVHPWADAVEHYAMAWCDRAAASRLARRAVDHRRRCAPAFPATGHRAHPRRLPRGQVHVAGGRVVGHPRRRHHRPRTPRRRPRLPDRSPVDHPGHEPGADGPGARAAARLGAGLRPSGSTRSSCGCVRRRHHLAGHRPVSRSGTRLGAGDARDDRLRRGARSPGQR
jgi:hypothetical protein